MIYFTIIMQLLMKLYGVLGLGLRVRAFWVYGLIRVRGLGFRV